MQIYDDKKRKLRNEKMFKAYGKGATMAELGRQFDLAGPSVVKALKKAGVYDESRIINKKIALAKRNKKICKLYLKKQSINSIARQFKLDHKTVRVILKKASIYKKTIFVRPKLSKAQIKERNKEMCQLYKLGETFASLARRYHRDQKSIVAVLKKAGIYKPVIIQLSREEKAERRLQIVDMHRSGMSDYAIARALLMSRTSVSLIIKNLGLR